MAGKKHRVLKHLLADFGSIRRLHAENLENLLTVCSRAEVKPLFPCAVSGGGAHARLPSQHLSLLSTKKRTKRFQLRLHGRQLSHPPRALNPAQTSGKSQLTNSDVNWSLAFGGIRKHGPSVQPNVTPEQRDEFCECL